MYVLVFGNNFLKSARKLEKNTRVNLDSVLKILSEDPVDPRIHSKPLHGKLGSTILLTIVAHRNEVYR